MLSKYIAGVFFTGVLFAFAVTIAIVAANVIAPLM